MSDTTKEQPKTEDLMGYEAQIAPETTLPATSNAEDVQSLINKTAKEVTVGEDGKYIYPDDIDPMLKAAVAATKSYRDNQSGFTKSQQSLKEAEAESEALREKLATYTAKSLELTNEDQTRLNALKTSNPDEWRAELNRLESEAKASIQTELDNVTEEVRQKASGEFELDRRYAYLKEFNVGREIEITPELLDTDIPPRITKKLAEASITFEEYLDEVSEYLSKGKVVSKPGDTTTTNLNQANGSSTPGKQTKKDGEIDYTSQTF